MLKQPLLCDLLSVLSSLVNDVNILPRDLKQPTGGQVAHTDQSRGFSPGPGVIESVTGANIPGLKLTLIQ